MRRGKRSPQGPGETGVDPAADDVTMAKAKPTRALAEYDARSQYMLSRGHAGLDQRQPGFCPPSGGLSVIAWAGQPSTERARERWLSQTVRARPKRFQRGAHRNPGFTNQSARSRGALASWAVSQSQLSGAVRGEAREETGLSCARDRHGLSARDCARHGTDAFISAAASVRPPPTWVVRPGSGRGSAAAVLLDCSRCTVRQQCSDAAIDIAT